MPSPHERYRLPNAKFPLRFTFINSAWRLEVSEVFGTAVWRCYIRGPKKIMVASRVGKPGLLLLLRKTGIKVAPHSFAASIFRHLETLGLAKLIHPPRSRAL